MSINAAGVSSRFDLTYCLLKDVSLSNFDIELSKNNRQILRHVRTSNRHNFSWYKQSETRIQLKKKQKIQKKIKIFLEFSKKKFKKDFQKKKFENIFF